MESVLGFVFSTILIDGCSAAYNARSSRGSSLSGGSLIVVIVVPVVVLTVLLVVALVCQYKKNGQPKRTVIHPSPPSTPVYIDNPPLYEDLSPAYDFPPPYAAPSAPIASKNVKITSQT